MNFKALYAKLFLGWHLLLRILKRLCFIRSPGYADFIRFYQQDRIVPYTLEEKKLLSHFSRCLGCGLCDSTCLALSDKKLHPSLLPAFSRSVPDFAGYLDLDLSLCEQCAGCEAVCPTHVPLRRLMHFIRDKENESLASPS